MPVKAIRLKWIRAWALALLALTLALPGGRLGVFAPALAEESGALNLLLIGVDGGDESDGRSDTMLLAHIDPANNEVKLVSFLRDLYVSVPGHGKTRLNAAYFYGGEALLKKTLENQFNVRVDRTLTVGFSMLAELIDQLGGVEVQVESGELPRLNEVLTAYNLKVGLGATHGLVKEAGLQALDGKQALSYCRIRKADSDFQRTARQQRVLSALLEKARELPFWEKTRLIARNLGKVRTDLTLADAGALLPLLLHGEAPGVQTARVPFDGAFAEETVDGMEVLTPNLKRNAALLGAFLAGDGN